MLIALLGQVFVWRRGAAKQKINPPRPLQLCGENIGLEGGSYAGRTGD